MPLVRRVLCEQQAFGLQTTWLNIMLIDPFFMQLGVGLQPQPLPPVGLQLSHKQQSM
jgi:hypothetical protein